MEKTSSRVLKDAVISTINESNGLKLENLSVIYSESLRRLEENKKCLIRETVNEEKVDKLMNEVLLFFNRDLKKELEKRDPRRELNRAKQIKGGGIWSIIRFAKIQNAKISFPHFNTLRNKFINSAPDMEDIELLAQAIYFYNLYLSESINFYFASIDHHFVEIEKDGIVNSFVPDLIKEKFKVECLKPEKVFGLIK
ncbi:MAG: hypothetical protein KKD48_03375 [Nanoarchaeota archaeon]|nr:hypothetical protein [Nanoarchaeota archaeon]